LQTTAAWQHGVLDPQGPIAAAERTILLNATVIMLAVIVPVIVLTLAFAWWFRAGNKWARRLPHWEYSGPIEVTVWSIPILVILFLGGIAWVGSHDLDPAKPLPSPVMPLEVEVVSLDWKWLFIYPELGVASVNRLVVPAGVPLHMHLTSASVMNSFFVPQLGSQIYAMAGMTSNLNLLAEKPGTYQGMSAQFSGAGFSDMRFDTVAMPSAQFAEWLATTRRGTETLDALRYLQLAQPGVPAAPSTYSVISPHLFDTILKSSMAVPIRTE
jgi:cytochrome o ubiquinol oxidase subunit 2